MDGVNMAGIKAFAKKTSEMKTVIQSLIDENKKLREELSSIKKVSSELLELKEELQEQLKVVQAKSEKNKTMVAQKTN